MSGSATHDNAGAYAGWSALDALEDVIMTTAQGTSRATAL